MFEKKIKDRKNLGMLKAEIEPDCFSYTSMFT